MTIGEREKKAETVGVKSVKGRDVNPVYFAITFVDLI